MKRRSIPKPKRDHEAEQIKRMTTLSLTHNEVRERLFADKAALEARLKEVFELRRMGCDCADLIRGISAELRAVKSSLKLVGAQ